MRRIGLLGVLLIAIAAPSSSAQSGARDVPPNDSLFRRSRRLVSEGSGTAGRAVVDSVLRGAEEGSTAYGDALYWRGALAETAAEAERDYRRVIVEYPLSYYADDALLALALLEQARGNRAGALLHLQRFVREHPISSARGVAALAAARLAFEQRDTRIGCAMISEARASASATDVELRNQIDYFGTRCVTAADAEARSPNSGAAPTPTHDSMPAAFVPAKKVVAVDAPKTITPLAVQPKPSTSAPSLTPAATLAKARGIYTIQLAAYGSRADAERLVAKLATRGIKARINGTTKPFRVRLALYPTRQAAQEEAESLKQRGIIGFVTAEDPAPAEKSP